LEGGEICERGGSGGVFFLLVDGKKGGSFITIRAVLVNCALGGGGKVRE